MRTTLNLADDVLLAAKEVARRDKRSVGDVISDLARRALSAAPVAAPAQRRNPRHRGLAALGIETLPRRGGVVTNDLIDKLRANGNY